MCIRDSFKAVDKLARQERIDLLAAIVIDPAGIAQEAQNCAAIAIVHGAIELIANHRTPYLSLIPT